MLKAHKTIEVEFQHWKKQTSFGLTEKTKTELDDYLVKLQSFFEKYYTDEIIQSFGNDDSEDINIESEYQLPSAQSVIELLTNFINVMKETTAYDEHSIHLSWIYHVSYLADTGQNLFIHELAHYIDTKLGLTLFSLDEQVWDKLYIEYAQGNKWMGEYALTNRKEYFAVATEFFFRAPEFVKENDPKLFKELKKLYKKEPKARPRATYKQVMSLVGLVDYYETKSEQKVA